MAAYEFTCAVSGLSAGGVNRRDAMNLMDAAHIRPVRESGPDIVGNGISLTPTVHRLFDEGLVSMRWADRSLELVVSPRLDSRMISSPERGTQIRLEPGTSLIRPADPGAWPRRDLVRYHQRQVFKGPESLTR